jgi:type I site-specific restriction endonuclease
MDKKKLSERDICTKFITPALEKAGWDKELQILEEVSFTDGKIYVRGKITAAVVKHSTMPSKNWNTNYIQLHN